MSKIIYAFNLLFIVISVSYSQSQTADEIINQNLKARGGKSMFKDLKTLSFTANVKTSSQMVTMQVYVQYPDKLRVELKNPTGDIVTSVFDGKKGWVIKGTAFRPFPEGYYDALRAQIDGQIGFFYKNLTNIKKRKIKAEYSGEGENRNMQVAKLTVTEANGAQWLVYFEKSRYFDIRYDFLKDIKGNKQNSTFHIRNFIPVGGYYFASAADVYTNNTESGSIVFSDIVVNPKLNKSLFLIPKK